jgi:Fungal specific transcription factor domain
MSNAAVSRTSNDEEVISPLLSTPEPSNFLFVNETSHTPSFKQGKRRDVKSHVRRLAHEQFRKTHKTPLKRATTLPTYAPLVSQSLDSETSKDLEHDKDCLSRSSPITSSGLATPDSDSASGVTLVELYESESPNATILQSTVDENSEPSERQGPGPYCRACGQPLQRIRHLSKDRGLIRRSFKRGMPLPNPVGVLGAGRVDPFSTLPMEEPNLHSQELLDHGEYNPSFCRFHISLPRPMKTHALPTAVTYLLPGLLPDKSLPSEANPITKAYFSAGLQTPLVFHALVYTGSNHMDYLRSSTISPNAPTPLFHKTMVIQKLKEALSDPDPRQALTDEVIVGILVLATQEVYMTKDEKPSSFIAPLPNLGWLNIYSNFKVVPQHAKAIADIIAIRGGLETIKLYKLAEIIIAYIKSFS